MNTNFEITTQTFKSLHEPLQPLPRSCLFTKLFKSRDNKVIKRKQFQTKKEWLTWKNSIIRELLNQRILSSKYPDKVLTILNYTVETSNHQRNLYITYDCGDEVEPLFQYLNNNSISFQEQAQIFEQILQITCILFKSQFEHTNLKPNNILYNKKQVLITDFGSARTHYQNFTKEHTALAEKDWQNNLIFFYPQEYQKIMQEDNLDFRNDQWQEVDISNQNFRKSIDIWALSMMMIQVFENNQTLPKKLTDYYGLNEQLLNQKIENLKQYSAGIFSEVIYSLLIGKKEPEQVYQRFIKQKQMLNIVSPQIESTFTIQQIFDNENFIDDDVSIPPQKPENYFLDKNQIKNLQGQFDDDVSSVKSINYQINIIEYTEIKSTNNLKQPPTLLPPGRKIGKKPETQKYDITTTPNVNPLSEIKDNEKPVKGKRPTILVTHYDEAKQEDQNQVNPFQDEQGKDKLVPFNPYKPFIFGRNEQPEKVPLTQIKDPSDVTQPIIPSPPKDPQQSDLLVITNLQPFEEDKSPPHSPSSPSQDGNSSFQFFKPQNLDAFNEQGVKVDPTQPSIPIKDQYIPEQNGNYNLLSIEDFDSPKPPPIPPPEVPIIIQPGNGKSIKTIQDPIIKIPKPPDIPITLIPIKPTNIGDVSGDPVTDIHEPNYVSPKQIKDIQNFKQQEQLVQVPIIDDPFQKNPLDSNISRIIQVGGINKITQPLQPILNPIDQKGQQLGKNPSSLDYIKERLKKGVTTLKEEDQKDLLVQLQMIQRVLNNIQKHITDPKEILDLEFEKQQQIPQFINDVLQQNEKEQLILFKDVNDGVESIIQNQQACQLIQNNQIEKNLHLLNILNPVQLEQGKVGLQSNKILLAEIEKLIEAKKNLNKFIENPNMQNLLQKQQIDLLNKEELKIYKNLLEIMPKDRRQGDKILTQQAEVEKRLKQIEQKKQDEEIQQKLIEFLKNPSFDKLLPNIYLKQLDDEKKQKYKEALEKLLNKVQQRQKQAIQEQIDIINKDIKKNKPGDIRIENKKLKPENNNNNNKPSINQNFQDAYLNVMKKLGDEVDGDLLSLNQYIREFQLTSVNYQLTDLLPNDCQKYQEQVTKRIPKFYDFQGSKYKGETLNDQPDGIGILRKNGVSSIYKGVFKQGKFFWGQVLEMNDQGQLTQYIGYYNQQHQVKHGKAKLRWYQPQKIGFCGGYHFNDYESYEGDFVLGYMHGKGKKTYSDSSEYEGDWKKNKREGQGRYTLQKQGKKTITYEGQFQNDFQHGKDVKAIHHHQTGLDLVVQGEYRHGKPIGQHILIFNDVPQRQIDY
ncbi:unnamed protein product [Paramecium pentaurelia]|uniref:MORN repeat-containing protein 3 n=1 Tax=Paramecium pentaurelia TaxID=43138 RepID=A0A8S1X3C6_9CILI|nr:unnamed protein product [Paramecium pentaurelia]